MEEQLYQVYKLFSKLILGDLVREGTSTSIKHTLISILRYSRLSGIMTIDIDRKLKSTFFRMYSMDSFELIFECELYYGFEEYYRQISQTVWAFQFLQGIIAFEFLNQKEGMQVYSAVKKHSHKMSEYFGILQSRRKEEVNKKKEGSFFGKIKNMFSKDTGKKEDSKIMNVKKQNSITFDQMTGKFENIPPHLELAFSQLGFTKKQLDNKQTARHLVQDLLDYKLIKQATNDPSATQLRLTLKKFGLQSQQPCLPFSANIPPPPPLNLIPPPPPLNLIPSPPPFSIPNPLVSSAPCSINNQSSNSKINNGLTQKADLLQQIRKGVTLKKVVKQQNKIVIEVSSMDKDQRQDMGNYLRRRMKQRGDYQRRNRKVQSDSDGQ